MIGSLIGLVIHAAADVVNIAFLLLIAMIVARFVIAATEVGLKHPLVRITFQVTELLAEPIRRRLGLRAAAIDHSILILFLLAVFFRTLAVGFLDLLVKALAG